MTQDRVYISCVGDVKISRFRRIIAKRLIFYWLFDALSVPLRHQDYNNMAIKGIIGRHEEIKKLEKFLKSYKSEFVAIYGRRRVGKSYLVEEVYKGKIVFRAIGAYIKDKDEKTYIPPEQATYKDPLDSTGDGNYKRCHTWNAHKGREPGGDAGRTV